MAQQEGYYIRLGIGKLKVQEYVVCSLVEYIHVIYMKATGLVFHITARCLLGLILVARRKLKTK